MYATTFLVAFLAAIPAGADSLSDVRTVLTNLRGIRPVTAHVEITRSRHSKGRFLNDDFQGSAVVQVQDDGTALRVTFPRELVDPIQPAGTSNAVAELVPVSIENCVDFGRPLLRMLSAARVTGERRETHGGRASQAIAISLPPGSDGPSGQFGTVTFREDRLTIWCGADHVPFAAQRVRKGSAGMLFLRVETVRTETWSFAVDADHLVATRFEDFSSVSGPGQSGEARSVWTVRDVTMP